MAPAGLRATFFAGDDFRRPLLTRTDKAINFNWDYDAPAFVVPRENYCVRWTGALRAPVSGTYIFRISTDDGMRVWLDEKQIFNEWRPQSPSTFQTKVELKAGEFYPLRVDYYQLGYQARAVLSWQLPPDAKPVAGKLFGLLKPKPTPIPASAFFVRMPPKSPPAPVAAATSVTPPVVAPAPAEKPVEAAKPVAKPVVKPVAKPVAKPVRRPTPSLASKARPAVAGATATTPNLGTLPKGATLEIKDLFFEQSQAELLPASAPAITRLAAELAQYPRVALEIAGHTDNVGNPVANQQLSEARARRVRALLMARGIDSTRLTAVGYGGTRPISVSLDPLTRARNRRVELTVR